jgi:hypothetical protein
MQLMENEAEAKYDVLSAGPALMVVPSEFGVGFWCGMPNSEIEIQKTTGY